MLTKIIHVHKNKEICKLHNCEQTQVEGMTRKFELRGPPLSYQKCFLTVYMEGLMSCLLK